MPKIMIGARTIRYDVSRSSRANRKRIEVTPGGVDVIVPATATEDEVERFVESRSRWLHDKTEEVAEEVERLRAETPEGFHSGAKILFRGRYLKLRVESADVDEPELVYRTAFHVRVPNNLESDEREKTVRSVIRDWLDMRLQKDAREVVQSRGIPHGLEPRGIQIKDQRTQWGSCGRDGIIRLDRKLTRLPKAVFEYVMVHELCHLKYRDHSRRFWEKVKAMLPDYEERKAWLEEHEVRLG